MNNDIYPTYIETGEPVMIHHHTNAFLDVELIKFLNKGTYQIIYLDRRRDNLYNRKNKKRKRVQKIIKRGW